MSKGEWRSSSLSASSTASAPHLHVDDTPLFRMKYDDDALHLQQSFSENLPKHANDDYSIEHATINLLCDRLNTPGDNNGSPPACRVYKNDDYCEVVAFDPLTCKTLSFKAELVVDITFSASLSASGKWWARSGWMKTKSALEEKKEKKTRLIHDFGPKSLDIACAVVAFIVMLSIAQVSEYEMPFIIFVVGSIILFWYKKANFQAFSSFSCAFLLAALGWSILRFASKITSCGDHDDDGGGGDTTYQRRCKKINFMCSLSCKLHRNHKNASSVEENAEYDDYYDHIKNDCTTSAQCDDADKTVMWAILFNFCLFVIAQLRHIRGEGWFFGEETTVTAPGRDSRGEDELSAAPRLAITVRHLDAATVLTKHCRVRSSTFHGSLDTYHALSNLVHHPSMADGSRRAKLLKSLSAADTNVTSSAAIYQIYGSINDGGQAQEASFQMGKSFLPPLTWRSFFFYSFLLVIIAINIALLWAPVRRFPGGEEAVLTIEKVFAWLLAILLLLTLIGLLSFVVIAQIRLK